MQDPQSMPGTFCPRNKFGLTNYDQLQLVEAPAVHRRQLQLEEQPMKGHFDSAHLQEIHWFLFRDVFPWAGEFRVAHMSKVGGAEFAFPHLIVPSLTEAFISLKNEEFLTGLGRQKFVERAAFYFGELNAIHPFREGNGRTQREFIRQLGRHCGFLIAWEGISKEENVVASVLSHTRGDNSGLAAILNRVIVGVV